MIKLLKVILLLTPAVKTSSNYIDIGAIKKAPTVLHCCRTTMSCTEGTATRQTRLVPLHCRAAGSEWATLEIRTRDTLSWTIICVNN